MSVVKFNMLIVSFCRANKLELKKEFQFCKGRRWKADYYIPELNVLIEYEGLGVGRNKFRAGGHQTVKGYTANCDKYNRASMLGYKLIRYTALNFGNVNDDLNYFLSL
jgi:hypothetical protein